MTDFVNNFWPSSNDGQKKYKKLPKQKLCISIKFYELNYLVLALNFATLKYDSFGLMGRNSTQMQSETSPKFNSDPKPELDCLDTRDLSSKLQNNSTQDLLQRSLFISLLANYVILDLNNKPWPRGQSHDFLRHFWRFSFEISLYSNRH